MPKLLPETAKRRATNLVKSLTANNFNESAVARLEGVTPQAINQRLKQKPVQDTLRAYIESPELKKKLVEVANQALKANTVKFKKGKDKSGKEIITARTIPDHDARHKYWHDLVTAGGVLKNDGSGGIKIINIVHAYRKEKDATNT